jgi:hypothetical protein
MSAMIRAAIRATATWHEPVKPVICSFTTFVPRRPRTAAVAASRAIANQAFADYIDVSVTHKHGGLQTWRKLVRIINALVSLKGIKSVASNVNRFNRPDTYDFFRGIGYQVGVYPIPDWNKLSNDNLFIIVANVMTHISGSSVNKAAASKIMLRNVGCSYKFNETVAASLRLPKHRKFILKAC